MVQNKAEQVDRFLLLIVILIVLALLTIPSFYLTRIVFQLSYMESLPLILLPFLSIIAAILLTGNLRGVFGKLPYIKYRHEFPLLYYYDDKPRHYRYKCYEDITGLIKTGDILLRRHDHYIDGLVLRQNSYYTHAGIALKNEETGTVQVYHAIGSLGVSLQNIEDFARCDDIAVLRFNPKAYMQEYLRKHSRSGFVQTRGLNSKRVSKVEQVKVSIPDRNKVKGANHFDLRDVRSLIENNDLEIYIDGRSAKEIELELYDELSQRIKEGNYEPPSEDRIIPLIMGLAEGSKGVPYDFDFNFINFRTMSCVEFVWFCYKGLFPIHQVRRKIFKYFGFINTYILVPDLFLASHSFDLVYSGMEGVNHNKFRLQKIIREDRIRFWNFTFYLVCCQVFLLIIYWMIRR